MPKYRVTYSDGTAEVIESDTPPQVDPEFAAKAAETTKALELNPRNLLAALSRYGLPVLGGKFGTPGVIAGGLLGEAGAQQVENPGQDLSQLNPTRLGLAAGVPAATRIGTGAAMAGSGLFRSLFPKPLPVRGPLGRMQAGGPGLGAPSTGERQAMDALQPLGQIDIPGLARRSLIGAAGGYGAQQVGAGIPGLPLMVGVGNAALETSGPLLQTLMKLYRAAPSNPVVEALLSDAFRAP